MRRTVLTLAAVLAMLLGVAAAGLTGNVAAEKVEGADRGGRPLFTDLTGAAETPIPGDPNGSGMALVTVNVGQATVCWEITVADIATATAAHIHEAPVGSPGDVVVSLLTPAGGGLTGCIEVEQSLAKDILQNVEAYYVNVHNADFPGGALRGQLG